MRGSVDITETELPGAKYTGIVFDMAKLTRLMMRRKQAPSESGR
jgi:hypothetical protein